MRNSRWRAAQFVTAGVPRMKKGAAGKLRLRSCLVKALKATDQRTCS